MDAVEHPLHTKPVRELAAVIALGLHAERSRYPSAICQTDQQLLRSFTVLHHEDMRGASVPFLLCQKTEFCHLPSRA